MALETVAGDTTPEAARVQAEVYRRIAPLRRLQLACEISDYVRALAVAGVRRRHPDYTEEDAKLAVTRMCIGEELFQRVYPGRDVRP